jgi:hypothetical protein
LADDYGLGLIVRLVRPFVLFIRGSGTYLLAVYASGSVLWPVVARELSRSQQRRARVVFVRALCTLANAGGVRSSSSASSSRPSSARVSSVSHSSNWPTSSCIHTAPRSSAYSSAVFSSSHPMSSSAPVPRATLPCAAAPHRLLRSATPHLRVTHALRFELLHLDLSWHPASSFQVSSSVASNSATWSMVSHCSASASSPALEPFPFDFARRPPQRHDQLQRAFCVGPLTSTS